MSKPVLQSRDQGEVSLKLADFLDKYAHQDGSLATIRFAGILLLVVTVGTFLGGFVGLFQGAWYQSAWLLGAVLSGFILGATFGIRRLVRDLHRFLEGLEDPDEA